MEEMKETTNEICKKAYHIRNELVELKRYAFCRGLILIPLCNALEDIIGLINSLESRRSKL